MLAELRIENLAIIESLTLGFEDGLCVITGETGAGKSLIVGAIKLLLGERGGADKIRAGANEIRISARFFPTKSALEVARGMGIEEDEITIMRRITKAGRSYFWINGIPTTAENVKRIGKFLADLHGQHSHQMLLDSNLHLNILDIFGGVERERKMVETLYDEFQAKKRELDELVRRRDEVLRQRRLLQFELRELTNANLNDPDEESKLEEELSRIESAEAILEFAELLRQSVFGESMSIADIAGKIKANAEELSHISEVRNAVELIDTILAATDEIRIIADKLAEVEYDPERAEQIRKRLALLGDLQKKYGKNLKQLIEYRDKLAEQSVEELDVDEAIEKLKGELSEIRTRLEDAAAKLSLLREKAAKKLSKAVEKELAPLALENAKFEVELKRQQDESSEFRLNGVPMRLGRHGFEKAEFLISTNPGMPLRPLKDIASGGELSRIALALKVALPAWKEVGCCVFDEIDVGIGGRTALFVAEQLEKLAQDRQVIVITHLHQIARRAKCHIVVEKYQMQGETFVSARMLSSDEREKELSRMLAIE